MRARTAVALVGILALLAAAGSYALVGPPDDGLRLTEEWVSSGGHTIEGNHHAPTAGRVGDRFMVFAPVSGTAGTTQCALFGLHGRNGTTRWRYPIPSDSCAIHAVADPTMGDADNDGDAEVLAATTEHELVALDPATGAEAFTHTLGSYGYTKPLIVDINDDGLSELVISDVTGTVSVIRSDGGRVWNRSLDAFVWAQPTAAEFSADGSTELVVATDAGDVWLFDAEGQVTWKRSIDSPVTWLTAGQADTDPPLEIVVATTDGRVVALDGATGSSEWNQSFGPFAAVRAFGDGDTDGDTEVYAVARDGRLRSIDARDGTIEWTTILTRDDVQMMPPPVLGDVDGDGLVDLVAPTNGGRVTVVAPATGAVRTSYDRDVPVFTHPVLADSDGDGAKEIFVMYADGRVVALAATPGT